MPDYLIVVDSENPIPHDFAGTVELVSVTNDRGRKFLVEKETAAHYLELKKYLAEKENIIVDLDSATVTRRISRGSGTNSPISSGSGMPKNTPPSRGRASTIQGLRSTSAS